MSRKRRQVFDTVDSQGGLLPPELLKRVADGDKDLDGLAPADYHLAEGERLTEAVSRSWNRLVGAWAGFRYTREAKPDAPDTGLTRDRWLLILFDELGYGRLQPSKTISIEDRDYPISHMWGATPIHLLGYRTELDKRTPGKAGAARQSPHSLVQQFLNRSDDHLWAFLSNGLTLRLLRDNTSLTRQAYVEFDLEAMMEGDGYSDFVLLWLVCHQSRVEQRGDPPKPEGSWLEQWAKAATESGTRALEDLRQGVEKAIEALAGGFLAHPKNSALRDALREGQLTTQDYYREILRLVYRLLFLFVAEDRDLLLVPDKDDVEPAQRYRDHYSSHKLRELAYRRLAATPHGDLYRGLQVVMEGLGSDEGVPQLALPALGSFLWSDESLRHVGHAHLRNRDLLEAIKKLAYTDQDNRLVPVDYRNLGPEELGSVYESLLELHPQVNTESAHFSLDVGGGSERKTSGSYYTPTSLITCLLDSALDPVVDQALAGKSGKDAEEAILGLTVCDPAVGSGHFLIAAAHRLAKRLAAVRTGEEEPAPEAVRTALRDVIGRCVYGIDINPMAVELCKVSLWLEALEPGKPLSFLDHHVRLGNSLLGTTPGLLAEGIPDDAFKPIEGDVRAIVTGLKRQNREERRGQTSLFAGLGTASAELSQALQQGAKEVSRAGDQTVAAVRRMADRFRELQESEEYGQAKLLADAWCAAFAWRKDGAGPEPITEDVFRTIASGSELSEEVAAEVDRLADQYLFFHWHLAFPEIFGVPEDPSGVPGWKGGFHVVLGNPPWERLKLQEKEFFATRDPEIANAPTAAARRRLIGRLRDTNPALYQEFLDAKRAAEGASHFVRDSGRFPLCGRGDVNTYSVFAEGNRQAINATGSVGCIVPTGIATDDTTKYFFQDLTEKGSLVSLYDFENSEPLFPGVHRSYKFCLLTLAGAGRPAGTAAEFAFFLHDPEELKDDERRFPLSAEDIALVNPNTRTCPVFRTRRDAEITKGIYRRVPVLVKEGPPEENPWSVSFMRMFDMSNDSHLFRTMEELEPEGWKLEGNIFSRGDELYLPLYEGKMCQMWDHRAADVVVSDRARHRQAQPSVLPDKEHEDPLRFALPLRWVSEVAIGVASEGQVRPWALGFSSVTSPTNERSFIAYAIPRSGVGNSMPLLLTQAGLATLLLANMCAFVFDFVVRKKIGGVNLNFYLVKQFPLLEPAFYDKPCPWSPSETLSDWVNVRVLELAYTAWDMKAFAADHGYMSAPFKWDADRRSLLQAELDAAFFILYGMTTGDVEYIMDSFFGTRTKDERIYGEYRTKRLIVETYRTMSDAITAGTQHQSLLDPPPADPSLAHPRHSAPVSAA